MADIETIRHSAAHVMAEAVQSMFPDAKFGIGPSIDEGYYYDFDLPRPLTPEDLECIEGKMKEIVAAGLSFQRQDLPRDEARAYFAEHGQPYKVELIDNLPDETVSVYTQGNFTDLCRGPHLESTREIGAFKLLHTAGAYWRGDEHRPMLQRIYGTAFATEDELKAYLYKIEQAALRDHRKLGRDLDLFSIQEEAGPGLVHWHPKGGLVREIIEDFWRAEHRKRGYDIVYTPHIGRVELWKTSGHWGWYRENMYSPMDVENQQYMLKPMNCPFHILIYKSRLRSYRELPIRLAELGTVYRYERSGVLHGLLRVRGFTQDDAHIFCRPDQLEDELVGALQLARFLMETFGYSEYDIELSLRDPANIDKYAGSEEGWQHAEAALVGALEREGLPYKREDGEAKFYGPAIDIKLRDALGRAWQGPTIQVDFALAERFDLNFISDEGAHQRPVMVHRALLGSMERFIGGLVEHYGGAFPLWLAPVQATVIPIADRHAAYAEQVAAQIRESSLRVHVDQRRENLNYKIREAQMQKVPYMLVVGDREAANGTAAVRVRNGENLGAMPVSDFIMLASQISRSRSQKL
jgi:threonyl-tRNA synthetase